MLSTCPLPRLRPFFPALLSASSKRFATSMSAARPPGAPELRSSDGAPHDKLFAACSRLVPALSPSKHKGQAGRVGVVGGCREYTGAPYFAAQSALLVGADLAHVFCTSDAARVIKTYSPELIVHPSLRQNDEDSPPGGDAAEEVAAWFSRLDALAVGSGLGRDPAMLAAAARVVARAVASGLPVVLDGDGLSLVAEGPGGGALGMAGWAPGAASLLVLTPNPNELKRLCLGWLDEAAAADAAGEGEPARAAVKQLAAALGGATVLRKGATDIISDGSAVLECAGGGSPRRSGGQGDVLAGTTAVLVAWSRKAEAIEGDTMGGAGAPLAALAACQIVRTAAAAAFSSKKRAMVAGDVIDHLGAAVDALYPC